MILCVRIRRVGFEKFLLVSFLLCAILCNYFANTVFFCVLRIYLMSYDILSACFICNLYLLLVLTVSERHRKGGYLLDTIFHYN